MSYVHQHTHIPDQGFPAVEITLRGKAAEEYTVICNDIAYLAEKAEAVAEKLHKAVEKLGALTKPSSREIPRPARTVFPRTDAATTASISEVPPTTTETTTEKGAHNGTDR